MHILSFNIEGLSDLPNLGWDVAEQGTIFYGPDPKSTAVADALSLAFASFDGELLTKCLDGWGWGVTDVFEEGGRVVECHWKHSDLAEHWVHPDFRRRVRVDLSLSMSAEMIALIRSAASRNPGIVSAVLRSPILHLSVSGLFSNTHQQMSIGLNTLKIGECDVQSGSEAPNWLNKLWPILSHSFARGPSHQDIPTWSALCAFSTRHHDRYLSFVDALSEFSPLRLVRVGEQWTLLSDEKPFSRWGYEGALCLDQAAVLYLSGASIVWLDGQRRCDLGEGIQLWGSRASGVKLDQEKESGVLSFKDQ